MFAFIVCAMFLSSTIDEAQSKYIYIPEISGWIKPHKLMATWYEAHSLCYSEDAVLMSPITSAMREVMTSHIRTKISKIVPYHIGTKADSNATKYKSLEGIDLDEMPLEDIYGPLDPHDGDCLSMDDHRIYANSCYKRLPFLCLSFNKTDCGPVSGYSYFEQTDKCYKLHQEPKTWDSAQQQCVAEGGHLLVINDDKEAQIARNVSLGEYPFVGLRYYDVDKVWRSINGDAIEDIYNKWVRNPRLDEGVCAIIMPSGLLSNYLCGDIDEREYLCEKHSNRTSVPVY